LSSIFSFLSISEEDQKQSEVFQISEQSKPISNGKSISPPPVTKHQHVSRCCLFLTTIRNNMDMTLLIDGQFMVFLVGSVISLVGFLIPYFFLPDHAMKTHSIDPIRAATLVSIIGITTIIGRLVSGIVADRVQYAFGGSGSGRRILQYSLAMTLCGLTNVAIVLVRDFIAFCVYAVFFGLFMGKCSLDS